MSLPLTTSCSASADKTNYLTTLGKGYQEQPRPGRMANDNLASFTSRVLGIIMNTRERVTENGDGFLEIDARASESSRQPSSGPRRSESACAAAYHPGHVRTLRHSLAG